MPTFDRIIPVLTYRDIPTAHDFLVRAFGFAPGGVHRSAEGQPIHGEVRAGDAPIWLHRATAEDHLDSRSPSMSRIPDWLSTSMTSTRIISTLVRRVPTSTASPSISRMASVNTGLAIPKAIGGGL